MSVHNDLESLVNELQRFASQLLAQKPDTRHVASGLQHSASKLNELISKVKRLEREARRDD